MLASSIPYKFKTPWASDATAPQYVTSPIPAVSVGPAAGQDLGFPPATATDPSAGGTPPNINDVNGALNYETLWSQWLQAGAPVDYDATFSSNIGGYPRGAVLSAASVGAFWLSTTDNNTSDPDAGGANWVGFSAIHGIQVFSSSDTFTVPAGVTTVKVRLWAGGGGGGGCFGTGSAGSGAGGGGYVESTVPVTPGAAIAVTVGVGGAAGTNGSTPGNGGAGTSSSFGSFASASPGTGGNSAAGNVQNTAAGAGGTCAATFGGVLIAGSGGGFGFAISSSNVFGGGGGGTFGTSNSLATNNAVGIAGGFPGGGAGGGAFGSPGGTGGNGLVIVEY